MHQIVIGKTGVDYADKIGGGTIADMTEVNQLAQGAFAIFTDNGTLVTSGTSLTSIQMCKSWYIAMGQANGKPYLSTLIDRDAYDRRYCDYVAPVKPVKAVGYNGTSGNLNFPSTLVAGSLAIIRIGIRSPFFEPKEDKYSFEYKVRTGDTTATVLAAVRDGINAIPGIPVTAAITGTNQGLSFTANNFYYDFDVFVDELFIPSTRSTVTSVVFGKGTDPEIAQLEETGTTYRGNTSKFWFSDKLFSVTAETVSDEQYSMWNIEQKVDVMRGLNQSSQLMRVTIACPAGDQLDEINDILNDVIFVYPPNSGTQNSPSGV